MSNIYGIGHLVSFWSDSVDGSKHGHDGKLKSAAKEGQEVTTFKLVSPWEVGVWLPDTITPTDNNPYPERWLTARILEKGDKIVLKHPLVLEWKDLETPLELYVAINSELAYRLPGFWRRCDG